MFSLQEEEETVVNKDPFNLSNDEYYNPKLANDAALKANLGITLLQVTSLFLFFLGRARLLS